MSAIIVGLLLGFLLASQAAAQNAEFNYNGRVNANGQPFNGSGRFKFALVSQDGSQTYYANDGITLNGQEPTTYVTATVSNGFFSVNVGDTTIPGMAELNPTIFNSGPVFLRTWFSDGSGFELLTPDRRIVNPGILGIKSKSGIEIFVSPTAGNDSFSGLRVNRPKRTIQAAWDALPTLLETTATIRLADGVYREEVRMRGKSCAGDAVILFAGNKVNPANVRLTGANAGAETVAVRKHGFTFQNQSGVVIESMTIDRFAGNGVRLENEASVTLNDVVVHHTSEPGVLLSGLSKLRMNRGEIYSTNGASPLYLQQNSICTMTKTHVHDNRDAGNGHGVSSYFNSTLTLEECRFTNMDICVEAAYAGSVGLNLNVGKSILENSTIGYHVEANGTLAFGNVGSTFIGVTTPISLGTVEPAVIF